MKKTPGLQPSGTLFLLWLLSPFVLFYLSHELDSFLFVARAVPTHWLWF